MKEKLQLPGEQNEVETDSQTDNFLCWSDTPFANDGLLFLLLLLLTLLAAIIGASDNSSYSDVVTLARPSAVCYLVNAVLCCYNLCYTC